MELGLERVCVSSATSDWVSMVTLDATVSMSLAGCSSSLATLALPVVESGEKPLKSGIGENNGRENFLPFFTTDAHEGELAGDAPRFSVFFLRGLAASSSFSRQRTDDFLRRMSANRSSMVWSWDLRLASSDPKSSDGVSGVAGILRKQE